MYCLKNVFFYCSIIIGSWGCGSVGGGRFSGIVVKVVSYFRVKFFGSFFGWVVVVVFVRSFFGVSFVSSGSIFGVIGIMFDSGGRFGLSFGLCNMLS